MGSKSAFGTSSFLTLNIPPHQADTALAELPALFRETGATDLAFIVRAHPETPPLPDKVRRSMVLFDQAREVLRPVGVRCGVLIQTLMGHGERSTPVSPVTFQRLIDTHGKAQPTQFCPLDPDFLAHTDEACREIARHEPAFILLDDDVRLTNRAPLHFGCLCPLHLQLHARRTGTFIDREALIATLTGGLPALNTPTSNAMPDPGSEPPNGTDTAWAARKAWQETLDESLLILARRVRAAIDPVDPQIRAGLCVVAGMRPVTECLARALAGDTRPLIRVGQAFYNEQGAKSFPLVMASIALQRAALTDDVETLSEADTYPQTRYSLSVTGLRAYIAGSLLQGIDAPDLWISPTRNWMPDPGYRRMLAAHRGIFDALCAIGRRVDWKGSVCLTTGRERIRAPWTPELAQALPPPRWAAVLGRMGFPFRCGVTVSANGSPIHTLDGIAAHGLRDAEIRRLLAGRVLLDGEAAGILCARGYADRLGVRVTEDPALRCNYEWIEDGVLHQTSVDRHLLTARRRPVDIRRLTPLAPTVRTPAWLMRTPDFQHPDSERVAPSLTLFENPQGGRVAVFAHALSCFPELLFMNADRRQQIGDVLEWLRDDTWFSVLSEDDVYAREGVLPDHARLLAVFNLSLDPLETLIVKTRRRGKWDVARLTVAGTWEPIHTATGNHVLRIPGPVTTLDPWVLRLHQPMIRQGVHRQETRKDDNDRTIS